MNYNEQMVEEKIRKVAECNKHDCKGCASCAYYYAITRFCEDNVVLTKEEYDEIRERIDELEQLLLVTKTNAKLTQKKAIELFAEKLKRKHHEYYPNVPYEEFAKANIVCGDIDEVAKGIIEGELQ